MISVDVRLSKGLFKLDAQFQLPGTGVTGIYGPSGCGKTSLLRAIAGLEECSRGEIIVCGQHYLGEAATKKVHQRGLGLVFQHAALFPHLTVEENLLFGRKRLTIKPKISDLEAIFNLLGVENLLHRPVTGLSGGERQRVAIGRALLAEPKLLLMDEPLSGLDHEAQLQFMSFLENLFQQIEIPVFYVSHSSKEISRLADQLIVMEQGKVLAFGDIQQVLCRIDSPLARRESAFSVLRGRVEDSGNEDITAIRSAGGQTLLLPGNLRAAKQGDAVRLRVKARDVSLCLEKPEKSSILNIFPAKIKAISEESFEGSRVLQLAIGKDTLLAKVSDYSVKRLALEEGLELFAQIKSAALLE